MATGYTHAIKDGTPITFQQFALKCSRAMGAAIMQRDESPEVEIRERTLDDHYIENVAKSARRLGEATNRSLEEWAAMQDAEILEASAYREKYLADRDALQERYEAMRDEVEAWAPPTSEHEGLKKFMLEQLNSSIQFDCRGWVPSVPDRQSPDLYAQNQIARITREHARDIEQLGQERERVASQNAWVRALRDSLTP